jgi:hypothetical protein
MLEKETWENDENLIFQLRVEWSGFEVFVPAASESLTGAGAGTAVVTAVVTVVVTVVATLVAAVVEPGAGTKIAIVRAVVTARVLYTQDIYSHNPDMFCTLRSHNQLMGTLRLALHSKTHLVARQSILSCACGMFHTYRSKKSGIY